MEGWERAKMKGKAREIRGAISESVQPLPLRVRGIRAGVGPVVVSEVGAAVWAEVVGAEVEALVRVVPDLEEALELEGKLVDTFIRL